MYAQLCKRLSKEAPNFDPSGHRSTFLRLLLNVCRDKFVNRTQNSNLINHDGPLTPDEEEKKYVAKQKMLGNAKFIGELCKLDMLSGTISHFCIQTLLDITGSKAATIQDRCENIECLCQLIRTCGKNLDTEQGKGLMDQYFDKMAGCASNPKYPPRIRFMLRDVIELRRNNWIPRKVNTTEGPVPIHQLKTDDDDVLIRPGYMNRMHDRRNNDREPDSWMNKLPLNLQPGLNDMMFGSLSVSSPTPIIPTYNNGGSGGNNYNNRNRDGGDGGGRYNNQRNNHQNNYNNRYNNNKHNNQSSYNNSSHNNSFATGMLSNKDLAPRFKRALIPANQDSVENLQMRPAANSLLFKANMNIKTTLPLSQHPSTKLNNNSGGVGNHASQGIGMGGNVGGGSGHIHNEMGGMATNYKNGENGTSMNSNQSPLINSNNSQKMATPAPIKTILDKEPILIKQASLEKPNKQKKPKGPTKEEVLKKVTTFVADSLVCPTNETQNISDVVTEFLELKVPDKFMKDGIIYILYEVLEKNDQICDRVIEFFKSLKNQNKFNQVLVESIKAVINGMNEREVTIPRVTTLVAALLSRFVSTKLVKLSEISMYTENGQHYPLFLLILQQLHKTMGKPGLIEIFSQSKVNLMLSLPEIDRNKDRMAEILEDRNLSFLYPLLKVQAELWKQIQVDSNPTQFYKWIKENVESSCLTDPGFITALMTVLLKYITQATTLADGVDATKNPEKNVIEKEKAMLEKYCPVLSAFIQSNFDLQLVAIYALQTYCHSVDYPKGMLLRWFTALYELNVIEEESFLRWKEDITEVYPGKGKALFQVNTWLLWLKEAEDEEEDDE